MHGCKRAERAKRAEQRAHLDCNSHKDKPLFQTYIQTHWVVRTHPHPPPTYPLFPPSPPAHPNTRTRTRTRAHTHAHSGRGRTGIALLRVRVRVMVEMGVVGVVLATFTTLARTIIGGGRIGAHRRLLMHTRQTEVCVCVCARACICMCVPTLRTR